MKRTSFADKPCPVARTLDVVGHWWSFLIIRNAFYGQTRFSEFQESLGIAKNMLSARLKALVEAGVMARVSDRKGSKYAEYLLTEKGEALLPTLLSLFQWGEKYAPRHAGRSLELYDARTGQAIPAQAIIGTDGTPVPPSAVAARLPARQPVRQKSA